MYQQTIAAEVAFHGVGVHTGMPVSLVLIPAEANTGIVFRRRLDDGAVRDVRAISANAPQGDLSTMIGDGDGVVIATIEHLMAALYAAGIDNAIVEINAGETPIMDGCAAAFMAAIDDAGLVSQPVKRRYIRVLKTVTVEHNGARAEYRPHDATRFEVEIDFDCAAIGRQSYAADLTADRFKRDLAKARTFGFMKDVERLWAAGYALGSSLENSVVIDVDGGIVNPDGLRYEDEFVRHKALDAVGDQALAGSRIIGCYASYRGGHRLNAMALQALLSDASAFEYVELPARRTDPVRHAPLVAVAAPAYGPQML
ncbi:UDP-3-O-acyl-N-acetylglucosamine deacetylase [Fulvimarina sp. 2208YS6-2-32]|uniref:UDP-3-O-acyl-N-acetylglucosamine deacetylase n=1 Tax=Fulvimarina uroteuthidis TaxID=3098149 RepID=A0ABU5HXN5_9HYPH|nr:UDP-3-O-acyl-N-acetylglucosamine deacetylase [Fulvimarina sp. 2208YS6-2-32]MDY8107899.1 UDP-3-O-acyl-N-acetylglucosamine deacetylase [Fulvimarina sp. 2208YS6-2-32]